MIAFLCPLKNYENPYLSHTYYACYTFTVPDHASLEDPNHARAICTYSVPRTFCTRSKTPDVSHDQLKKHTSVVVVSAAEEKKFQNHH